MSSIAIRAILRLYLYAIENVGLKNGATRLLTGQAMAQYFTHRFSLQLDFYFPTKARPMTFGVEALHDLPHFIIRTSEEVVRGVTLEGFTFLNTKTASRIHRTL